MDTIRARLEPSIGAGAVAFLERLQLFRVFSAWWFTLLLALLVVSIVVCTLDRTPRLWRQSRHVRVRQPDAFYEPSLAKGSSCFRLHAPRRRRPARGRRDDRLHGRDDRAAEGRPAHARERDRRVPRRGCAPADHARRSRRVVHALGRHRRPLGQPLPPLDDVRRDGDLDPRPAHGRDPPARRAAERLGGAAPRTGRSSRRGSRPRGSPTRRRSPTTARRRSARASGSTGRAGCSAAPRRARSSVLEYFDALGLTILESWGMSETSCHVTINPPRRARFGTCGTVLDGSELQPRTRRRGARPGPARDGRLPRRAGDDRDRDRRRRLAAHRRRRHARRRRLPDDRRPQEGDHRQLGRQEHVARPTSRRG